MERVMVINLRKYLIEAPRVKRANRLIRILREKIQKNFKGCRILIDKSVNEEIWKRGAKKPPAKLKLKVKKSDDVVKVEVMA